MITVEQVLRLPGLGLEPVVEADTSLPVSWVVTSELPDPTPFLEGGEVVLLTGIRAGHGDRSWDGYAHRLAARGVVALGLGVGERLTHPAVPPELAAACRASGLTLFSVPEATPFLGILRATAEMRAAEERTALESMLAQQRALTRAAVGAGGPARVVRELAGALGAWTGVCTPDAEVLEASVPGPPALPSGRSLPELLARLRPAGLRGSLSESGPDGTVLVHPLGVGDLPRGYLVVVLPGPADPLRTGVVATAVALLSLHAERTAEQALFRRRARAGALALLLGGEVRSADALLAVAGDATWSSVPQVRVALLRGGAGPLEDAAHRLGTGPVRSGRPVLVGSPAERSAGELTAAVLVEDAPARLAELRAVAAATGLRAGIGGPVAVAEAAAGEREAREALARTTAQQPVAAWDDVVTAGVTALLDPDTARAWALALLRPLREERLRRLLRAYLAHNGHRARTANELGIHRNTLQQRLHEAETALGRSLEDPQLRAELWLALDLAEHPGRPAAASGHGATDPVHRAEETRNDSAER